MFDNVSNRGKYTLILLAHILVSVWVFRSAFSYTGFSYWGSIGDYGYSINPVNEINFSVYKDSPGGGYFAPFELSNIFPHQFIQLIFQLLDIPLYYATFTFVLIVYIFSGFFTTLSIEYFNNRIGNKSSIILGFLLSLIYVYSPYYGSLFSPGHFVIYMIFGFSPLLLMFIDRYINQRKFISQELIFFSILFIFLNSALANIAYFLILATFLVTATLFIGVTNSIKFKEYAIKSVILSILFFVSVAWWELPNIYYFYQTIFSQTTYSLSTIGGSLSTATEPYSIGNIFTYDVLDIYLKRLSNNTAFTMPMLILSHALLTCILILGGLKIKHRLYKTFVIMLLSGVFLLKGIHLPFSSFFTYLYENFSPFQLMRRPDSKVYWIFILMFVYCVSFYLYKVIDRSKRWVSLSIYFLIGLNAFLCILFFSNIFNIVPFNIPSTFTNLPQNISLNSRTLILPDNSGRPRFYDNSVNNLGGIDFIYKIWPTDILGYDVYNKLSLNNDLDESLHSLHRGILDNAVSCEDFSELGLSNILLLKNVSEIDLSTLNTYHESLRNISFFDEVKLEDGSHYALFSINNECGVTISYPIESSSDEVTYKRIKNYLYSVSVPPHELSLDLKLYRNNDGNWRLYKANSVFDLVSEVIKDSRGHPKSAEIPGYVNVWSIEAAVVKEEYYLFYLPQILAFLGAVITLLGFTIFGSLYFFDRTKGSEIK